MTATAEIYRKGVAQSPRLGTITLSRPTGGTMSAIQTLDIQNFTTLPNDTWRFASGLNVVVGENGLGKTHLLKLL
jgi:predicted ATP-binding protein involved in virulence